MNEIETELLYDYANEVDSPDEDAEYVEYPSPSNEAFKLYHQNMSNEKQDLLNIAEWYAKLAKEYRDKANKYVEKPVTKVWNTVTHYEGKLYVDQWLDAQDEFHAMDLCQDKYDVGCSLVYETPMGDKLEIIYNSYPF